MGSQEIFKLFTGPWKDRYDCQYLQAAMPSFRSDRLTAELRTKRFLFATRMLDSERGGC